MLLKNNWRGVMGVVILCIGLLFGLSSFVSADDKSKPDCILYGHITDSTTGQAITDALVEIHGGPISKVKADANGFYCFEKISKQGNYRIAIDSNEYVGIYNYDEMPSVNLKGDSQVVKDFKLSRACMIEMQVVDEAGKPIEGAELKATSLVDERSRDIGGQVRRNRTDKDGTLLLGGFPPSKTGYLITATHGIKITSLRKDGYGVVQTQWDYAPGHLEVTLNDTEVTESGRIVLQKGIDVNGIAQYQDGVPASDLKIEAYPDWWSSYTCPESYPIDANGCFIMRHVAAGMYRIQANIPTGKGSSIGITVSQTSLPLPNNEILKVTIPQKSPQALASIRGKFTFAGDKVPNYVDIQAYSPGSRYNSVMWNKYGRDLCDTNFVIDRLEPGKYRLTFSGENIEQKVLENVEAPTDGLIVELAPAEKPNLKGTVINSLTGQPIQKFKARARKVRTLRGANYQQSDRWLEVDDAEGRFSIGATGPGIYQIQIAAEGFAWACSENVNTDQNVPVVIKLSAGGGIKGKVVNESGKPVKGAKVLPLSMAGGVRIQAAYIQAPFISEDGAVETADEGIFELKHLAPGRESIKVIHPDYAYSIVNDIEVKEGQTTEGVNVVMPAGGTVEGFVYDVLGRAQPNVTLYFQDIHSGSSDEKARRFATVTTDANGYYRAGGLPEQLLTVRRQKERSSMGVDCRTLVPASGRVSRIDLGGRPIVSGLIIINGIPLANRRVILSSAESPHSDVFRCYAMTEPDGKFVFGGVPSGKWSIYYEDPEKYSNWIKVTVVNVTGQDVDMGMISVRLPTIRISVGYEEGASKWDISRTYLQEGNEFWGRQIAQLSEPADENEPYIIKNVPPGEYCLVLVRRDYLMLRYPVKVTEADMSMTVRIPKCTAGIKGLISGKIIMGQTIWTQDKSVVASLIPDEKGGFKLDNLPAGHYYVGGNMLISSAALLEFELADGEQKVLDVNIPDNPLKKQTGALQVIVLDENGSLIPGVEVHLLGGEGMIEPITNSGGRIYFMAEQGAYTLQVNFPGYKAETQQVSIEKFDPKNIQVLRKPVLVRLERQ
jgi:hypothetical protein